MARSKKSDDKPDESASLQISLEDFIRTRDSVSSYITFSVAKVEGFPFLNATTKRIPQYHTTS